MQCIDVLIRNINIQLQWTDVIKYKTMEIQLQWTDVLKQNIKIQLQWTYFRKPLKTNKHYNTIAMDRCVYTKHTHTIAMDRS